MYAILKKEINSFFASPIGYLVIGVFLTACGLFLWVFKGEYNILDNGFAEINGFFFLAPWLLLFLIPAVTMKGFSEEKKQGMLEILFTKPIGLPSLVWGKFLGAFILTLIAIIPTLLYVYTVYNLGAPIGNLDLGSILGSYLGLIFLMSAYTAIGLFASTLSENQIVAFIISICICFLLLYGPELLSSTGVSDNPILISSFGMKAHYENISRGIIDTRDMIYFLSFTFFFLYLTNVKLKNLHQ
ncbi:gliding motility-associated ABC transporter permease subunit GldF [Neptunitalea lumnitzerae]|uniref:Gliding motility-associated ABC transporter permease subunit GldF n=1 Tax=Neptunitalea lumnitzerae TaxID=2965509 RepID=A0ABQ5MII5_9FLAO|nr:gliding motility-associated ABC transporter permease subunit GldF [Neptunitalea sp. Y10]GLB49203.1 gliding motility-associated ABC transporter permease subunit GldF [Neptunitalea sp. Y10]